MTPVSPQLDAEELARFRAEGWIVTPPLFEESVVAEARAEVDRLWRARTEAIERRGENPDYARARPELQRLHLESDVLFAFCCAPRLVATVGALLGDDLDLSFNQGYAKAPGGDARTEIPWHQDAYYADVDAPACNVWVALTRTTIENGTMQRAPMERELLPHAWDPKLTFYRCAIDARTANPVELEPGQAFVFTGRVPHGSGVNTSREARIAYSISFAASRARLRVNGEAFGDRVPVLRGGRLVREVLAEYVRAGEPSSHEGARVVAEIEARAPARTEEARASFRRFASASAAGDDNDASRALGRFLTILPQDDEVLGDLVRSRARVDQILDELSKLRGADPEAERKLLARVLELDPHHPLAARATRDSGASDR
jgi:ectoine hydroxylase-related dioxygenase (phytanoyl-CoA dioxygenase family)